MCSSDLREEGKFKYVEEGEGSPIIILHGLMGGLTNFDDFKIGRASCRERV